MVSTVTPRKMLKAKWYHYYIRPYLHITVLTSI